MVTTMEKLTVVTSANWVPGPEQGNWTYNDYAALPDDGRHYEIVDGVLYMAPSPNEAHQDTVLEIALYLHTYIKVAKLGKVFVAPFDVELAPNMVVQPDVMVVLHARQEIITPSRIKGAPDLIIEVSSPATVGYDRRDKQDMYMRSSVTEYWIVDPATHTVEVMEFKEGSCRSLGVFTGQAAVVSRVVPTIAEVSVEKFFV